MVQGQCIKAIRVGVARNPRMVEAEIRFGLEQQKLTLEISK